MIFRDEENYAIYELGILEERIEQLSKFIEREGEILYTRDVCRIMNIPVPKKEETEDQ